MKVEFLNAQQVGEKLNELLGSTEQFYCAVAWASDIKFADKLLKNKNKICQLVIGTDYLGTDPEVLQMLKCVPKVRVMFKGQATFHPKIYCFIRGKNFSAIVGSSNLTNGGLSSNEEASVLIEGTTEDDFFKELSNKISSWWEKGVQIEDDWLSRYEEMWNKNKENRAKTKKLVDAIQPVKKELPTIAEFNVENSPRIHIVWWATACQKKRYANQEIQSRSRSFLYTETFLECDDIREGDWILKWKCDSSGVPTGNVCWMHVDEVIPKGYTMEEYTKLVVQTKANDLFPFTLDEKIENIIEYLQLEEFRKVFFKWDGWKSPAQDVVRKFLNHVQQKYEV